MADPNYIGSILPPLSTPGGQNPDRGSQMAFPPPPPLFGGGGGSPQQSVTRGTGGPTPGITPEPPFLPTPPIFPPTTNGGGPTSTTPRVTATLQGPIDDCMTSVTVFLSQDIITGDLPATTINVFVNGMLRGTVVTTLSPYFPGLYPNYPLAVEVPITGCCLKINDLVQFTFTAEGTTSDLDAGIRVESHVKYSCLTQHYNNFRTGWYPYETQLTVDLLQQSAPNDFKKQFEMPVDGKVYAQPLYMHHVNFPGHGAKNVVFIATENNTIYAYDADARGAKTVKGNQYPQGVLLWKRSLLMPGERSPTSGDSKFGTFDIDCADINPTVGISSTPVISCGCCNSCAGCSVGGCHSDSDSVTSECGSTIYIVTKTVSGQTGSGTFHIRLHALDVVTGAERAFSPVEISADERGTEGTPSTHTFSFSAEKQNNRCALLLVKGSVYVGFASHCDKPTYHGWIFSYDSKTLAQKSVFCTTPNGSEGGVWQGEFGLASDGSAIYFTTGNGTFDADAGGSDYGNSVMKLSPDLKVVSFFTPADQAVLNIYDRDLGSGGAMVIPVAQFGTSHPNLLVTCGKDGLVMLLDRDNLGGSQPSTTTWDANSVQASFDQYPGIPHAGAHSSNQTNNPFAVSTILLQPTVPPSYRNSNYNPKDPTTGTLFEPNQPGIWGGPAYLNNSNGQFIFYAGYPTGGGYGNLTAFALKTGKLVMRGTSSVAYQGLGTTPVVSTSFQDSNSSIVWVVQRAGSNYSVRLQAYDASRFQDSDINIPPLVDQLIGTWDTPTDANPHTEPFIEPTIVNGKVYVASGSFVGAFYCGNEITIT